MKKKKTIVVISVCLFVYSFITHKPIDQFASCCDWVTW